MSTVERACYDTRTDPELLDRRQAAELVGLSEASMRSARIGHVTIDGISWWQRDDLDAYLAKPRVRARRANPRRGDVGCATESAVEVPPVLADLDELEATGKIDQCLSAVGVEQLLTSRRAAVFLGLSLNSMSTKSIGITPAVVGTSHSEPLWRRGDLEAYLARPAVRARRERDARPEKPPQPLPGHKFPFEPLVALVHRDAGRILSVTETADALGINRAQVYTLTREGLTSAMADRLAVRAGWHPGIVWGADWWDESRHVPGVDLRRLRRQEAALRASQRRHPSSRWSSSSDLPPAA